MIDVARVPADLRETIERAIPETEEPGVRAEPAPTESVRLVAEPVILVTGFEPFGAHTVNPSQELAKILDGRRIGNCAVATRGAARAPPRSVAPRVRPPR